MAEDSSSKSPLTKYWSGYKEFWSERFSFLEHFTKFVNREKPLPRWTPSDIEEFIASDPVHGPTLKTTREAMNYGITGSIIGAVSTAGVAWKYSRSLHGAGLSLLAGGVFGWTFGQEAANHALQLYKLDTAVAQTKFLEWWDNKTQGRF